MGRASRRKRAASKDSGERARVRAETEWLGLRECLAGHAVLHPEDASPVQIAFERARQLARDTRDHGVNFTASDVAGLAIRRIIFARLRVWVAPGDITREITAHARGCACALALLVEPEAMERAGFAPMVLAPRTVEDLVVDVVRAWMQWNREVLGPALDGDDLRSVLLRGAVRTIGGLDDRAEETWPARRKLIADRLRKRRGLDVKPEDIDAELYLKMKERGPMDGLLRITSHGIYMKPSRAADLVPSAPHRPIHARQTVQPPSKPPEERTEADEKRAAEAARRVRGRRDALAARGASPALSTIEDVSGAKRVVPDLGVQDPDSTAVDAVAIVAAVRTVLKRIGQRRRRDDRVGPVVVRYFEAFLATGERPSQAELARHFRVNPGTLSRRISEAEAAMAEDPVLRRLAG